MGAGKPEAAWIVSRSPTRVTVEAAAARAGYLVLGESWSASRMLEECQRVNSRGHRAVRPEQLQAEWFRGAATVGVAAGNATPEWLVPRFAERIQALAGLVTCRARVTCCSAHWPPARRSRSAWWLPRWPSEL